MTTDTKLVLGVSIATVAIIAGAIFFLSGQSASPTTSETIADQNLLVRDSGYNTLGASATDPANPPAVVLVEFSDFQCPACRATAPIVKQVVSKYPNQVQLVYRHFPLSQHPFAEYAAQAAEAAGVQDKFWEMHDLIFANQDNLDRNLIKDLAKQIPDLNLEQFNQSLDGGEFKSLVINDLTQGNQLGVDATPTFFFNGVKLSQPISVESLSSLIEAAAAASGSTTPSDATPSSELSPSAITSPTAVASPSGFAN